MSLQIEYRPEALAEFDAAASWYDEQRDGLGAQLVLCVEAAILQAARTPKLFPKTHGEHRRNYVKRFPYVVYYRIEGETLWVVAVAHVRRRPGYWLDR